MQYIVIDLEATCWENVRTPVERSETIEIGAMRMRTPSGPLDDGFGRFVRPVASPKLSAFCTQLTSITQSDVDTAGYFWQVYPDFLAWIGDEPWTFCSWGNYDALQLQADCQRHRLPWPPTEHFINLKKAFATLYSRNQRPVGMARALFLLGLELEGQHHRGRDDAANIARIATYVLPKLP